MQIASRIYRRRSASTKEGAMFKKDLSKKNTFFSASAENFVRPASAIVPSSSVQRKCATCENDEKQMFKMHHKNEENKLQKKHSGTSNAVGPHTSSYINSLNGKGTHLPKQTNLFFSTKMGYDFSEVKIHTDKAASDSAKAVNAKAYTIGNNIVFDEGQYNIASTEGKRLMAHELTHVIQQNDKLNKINRYTTKETGGSYPGRIQEVNTAMNGASVILHKAIRAIQSILISGEQEPNSPVATALKTLFHCPTPKNIRAILADFQNVMQHFDSIQQLIIIYNAQSLEAVYDDALNAMTVSANFFRLTGPQQSFALLSRIIIPLYYMHTSVVGADFTNFSIPGDKMVGNEFSMQMFLSFIQKPVSFDAFGSIPCLQTAIQPSETNLRYSNTGFYVLVPHTLTSDTYLRRLTGYDSPRTGDRVGELLRDRFGLFIFYRSQRVYVNQYNKVMFPF